MHIKKPGNLPLAYLDFELLTLEKDQHTAWSSAMHETVFVIIEGAATLTAKGNAAILERKNVFGDLPSALFVSPNTPVTIHAAQKTTLALCKAKAHNKYPTKIISKDMIKEKMRGENGYRRRVINILNTETPAERIAVGETFNEPGGWSSFPPHKHDADVPGKEVPLEEIYYFKIEPQTAFGFQRVYTDDGSMEETYTIRDGDCVYLPRGYHPVVSMPKTRLYYLWMLAGNERTYIWNTDPNFEWML